ncbi:MAG: SUMF1/EgtB/PvdO family nonheme iron enzyme [Thermoanaerobaculales bacterium]|nr:SUMF1/EgtB/PvdO family nonheme iron enzyme [Thermoanaerobaculales bacterium]
MIPTLLTNPDRVTSADAVNARGCRRSHPGSPGGVLLIVVVVSVALASTAHAGPWSELPEAIDTLADGSANDAAERVLSRAEASMMAQAGEGRLEATDSLFDTYASLVSRLPNGSFRLRVVARRMARELLEVGDRIGSGDHRRAAAAWALAGEFDPDSPAVDRLRSLLFPPEDAEPGQTWRAPVDGATLIFHPATAIRLGCTLNDGDCRDNEVYFRWVEIPARWFESREVSNRRYRLCVDAGACTPPENPSAYVGPGTADHPVVGVSWRQARAYARWAGRRLPSEAEWERAARGEVTEARFPWGNKRRRELANVWLEPRSAVAGGTEAVGSFPAMGFGMRDIAGNVWEWCEDRYGRRFTDAVENGGASREGWGRVVRGGSWRRAVDMARVSTRSWYEIGYSADDLGFRCVVDHQARIPAERVVRIAQRAFPLSTDWGSPFAAAELGAEDRRYLERRQMTLFVVEGRTGEALIPAARRLEAERSDPVAGDIFARFEAEVFRYVTNGSFDDVRTGVAKYREAADEAPSLTGRFASFQRQLVLMLRGAVSSLEGRGDRAQAREAAVLGLEITPGDAIFAAAENRLARATGAIRVWSGDGKGMVWVSGGEFMMGASPSELSASDSERPPHRVEVQGFWMDRTEVTNDEYRSCVQAGVCSAPHRNEGFDDVRMGDHPVLGVDWFQAREYAAWAGKRLPTEAEWEIAARAGATTLFPWGSTWVPGRGNAMGAHREDVWSGTSPVASFEANAWGIYDLVGNVSEWVEDVFNESYYGAPRDGRAWYQETGLAGERRRVVRGGGYDDPPQRQRVTKRSGRRAVDFHRSVGFRCVADE